MVGQVPSLPSISWSLVVARAEVILEAAVEQVAIDPLSLVNPPVAVQLLSLP